MSTLFVDSLADKTMVFKHLPDVIHKNAESVKPLHGNK